jgi:hypothetical protein
MTGSSASAERATFRTVVLLRKSEKTSLERIAAKQQISSAEVIRRFIRHGDRLFRDQRDEKIIEAALKLISTAAREANESMVRTMKKVDRFHAELMRRDIP